MNRFKKIAIIGRQNRPGIKESLEALSYFLIKQDVEVFIEKTSGDLIADVSKKSNLNSIDYQELGKEQDLVIVVGGDGSLLNAAKAAVKYDTPVLGINRGSLGFLTDISPDDIENKVGEILNGHYKEEQRFLLHAKIHENGKTINEGFALNDVVLLPGKGAAQMIEFDVSVNKEFVCGHKSDGIIAATPTGSTAYSLSAGGPIISPDIDAIALVPMFPHTLTMRPYVVNANAKIKITIANHLETNPNVSCDGETPMTIPPGGHLHIDKSAYSLRLLHPENYAYYDTLRKKLHWGKKIC